MSDDQSDEVLHANPDEISDDPANEDSSANPD